MNQLLKLNQAIQLDNGKTCVVKEFLGSGGQGEVYRAESEGQSMALKWYYSQQATAEQRAALQELLAVGAPNTNFLFPLHLASSTENAGVWLCDVDSAKQLQKHFGFNETPH